MTRRPTGMVLFMTIMMISLLTLLVLSLLQSVFLYVKISHQVVAKHQAFHQLEAAAEQLVQSAPAAECLLTHENPNQMIALLSQKAGCLLKRENQSYTYLIDDLGLYPCLKIISDHQLQSSHHWLITIAKLASSPLILQIRVAKPSSVIACDGFEVRTINEGVISWRYLPFTQKIS